MINDLSDPLPVFQIFPYISTPEPKKIVFKKRAITKANMDELPVKFKILIGNF